MRIRQITLYFLKKDGSVDLGKSNLEWCSHLYNMRYGTGSKRAAEKRKILLSKPVLKIDKETNEIVAEYPSVMEATRQTGSSIGNISKCCNGKQKTYKGFKWKYKE